jgi:hypothetical protein
MMSMIVRDPLWGQIDHHAELVHSGDHRTAEIGQAAVPVGIVAASHDAVAAVDKLREPEAHAVEQIQVLHRIGQREAVGGLRGRIVGGHVVDHVRVGEVPVHGQVAARADLREL